MKSVMVYSKFKMSEKFVIQWKSSVNGRAGRGTKRFGRAEAERLIAELNQEYPSIQHELATPRPEPSEPAAEGAETDRSQEHIVSTE